MSYTDNGLSQRFFISSADNRAERRARDHQQTRIDRRRSPFPRIIMLTVAYQDSIKRFSASFAAISGGARETRAFAYISNIIDSLQALLHDR